MTTRSRLHSIRSSSWVRFGVAGAGLALAITVSAQTRGTMPAPQAKAPAGDQAALVARGEYLTHSVAMCVQCHSPRDQEGNILRSMEFHGAAIPFKSPFEDQPWALRAPNIAGLPGFTDEQIITLLMTGAATGRQPPQRPMPPFRMNHDDAAAIVAYLRSLS